MSKVLIELRNVVKSYDTASGPFFALKNVSLQVNAGEFAAVVGKSGSGKSTLINMITGIDRPTLGEVIVDDTPIHALSEDQMAVWRGKNLGVIFQFFQLLPTLTVLENVMLPMELSAQTSRGERADRAMHLLGMVALAEQAHKFPSALSGGQQQRAAIARALANNPNVLVADEPTGSLDSKTGDSIFQLFEEFVAQGRTVLMVTHDRSLASRVSRVIYLADGEVTDQVVRAALPSLTGDEQVQLFSKLEPVRFAPGALIIQQGDPAEHMYIIIKGEVEVFIQHPQGGEMMVNRIQSGQFFGEMGLIEGGVRTATVRAAPDSEVLAMQLDRESFLSLMQSSRLSKEEIIHRVQQRVLRAQLTARLPALGDQQSLLKDEDFELQEYEPGAIIVRQGDPVEKFFIVQQGEVEEYQEYPREGIQILTRYSKGEFFGDADLLRSGRSRYNLRAAPDSSAPVVQLIALDRQAFLSLIQESSLTRDEITRVMRQRVAERVKDFIPNLQRRPSGGDMLARLESDEN